jgi:hypothetical protein
MTLALMFCLLTQCRTVILALDPPPVLRLRVGDVLELRLPARGGSWWSLEHDRRLLARDRLSEREQGAQVYRLEARAPGTTTLKGWCAAGMERPCAVCEIEVEISE